MHQKLFCRRRALRLLLDIGYRRLFYLITSLLDSFDCFLHLNVGRNTNPLSLTPVGCINALSSMHYHISSRDWQYQTKAIRSYGIFTHQCHFFAILNQHRSIL